MDLGPMCRADFRVSEGASQVCGAVADFAAPPLLRELFRRMPLAEMLRGIEANAVKTVMLSWALDDDIASGFAEIQKQVEDEHSRNEVLSSERDSLALWVKALEEQVGVLQGDKATLEEEVRIERELSTSVGLAAWQAMEVIKGPFCSLVPCRQRGVAVRPRWTSRSSAFGAPGRCACRPPAHTATIARKQRGRRPLPPSTRLVAPT